MKPVEIDQALIEEGVRLILKGLGEDLEREGLLETPLRVARMYNESLQIKIFQQPDLRMRNSTTILYMKLLVG